LRFINVEGGPDRSTGHIRFEWDSILHKQVGSTYCRNDGKGLDCEAVGFVRHLGLKFSPHENGIVNAGLPITVQPDATGMTGGYGNGYICGCEMQSASSVEEVRGSLGSEYCVSPEGILTICPVQFSDEFTGNSDSGWIFQDSDTPGNRKNFALNEFERDGVPVPMFV